MTSKPEIPPPERKNGYAYGLDGFTVNKARRESHTRLNSLLLPENIKGKRAQKAAQEDAKRIVKKPWIEAQLKHYGIPFNSKAFVSDKQAALAQAVSDGLCNAVPEAVKSIEADLRQLFEPKKREYEVKLEESRVSEAARVNREFAALNSPTAETEYSMDMFLKKYFLDEAGKPDKSKTPEPISLPGFIQRSQMHAAAERVLGLETYSGGQGNDRTVVVGWDRSAVWRVAGQVDNQSALKLQQAEEAEWDKLMQRHESFVSQARSRYQAAEFSIREIGGIYVIECEKLGSYSSVESYNNDMRLRIMESRDEGWVGIFDFGVLEGIMLLDENKENLASRVASIDRESEYEDEDQDDFSSETGDSSQEDEDDDGNQRENNTASLAPPQKRKAHSPSPTTALPRKKQKQRKTNGGNIFLQWRGVETGEGEIQLDYSNEYVGQLNFSDDNGLEFEGTAGFGFVGSKVQFHGYKIQSLGGPVTRSWGDFSEAAHERARVARWH
ncbi:MAG: hypothetical protein Q9195_009093 [Heterodermia aff. obscurata]